MGKRELIVRELDGIPEERLDTVLKFVRAINLGESGETALLAESALAKDWLTAEEEEAWADL